LSGRGVPEQRVKPPFSLSGKHRDTELSAGSEIDGVAVQHGEATGNVKSAHGNRDSRLSERSRDVESARVLVRLNTDKRNQAEAAMPSKSGEQLGDIDATVRFVNGVDFQRYVGPENFAPGAVAGDGIDSS
jgi:hypothetical protein